MAWEVNMQNNNRLRCSRSWNTQAVLTMHYNNLKTPNINKCRG